MPSITLRHVDIDFPFPPYPQQARFMESLLQALQGGANALLESPTGTGKTLCLLCGALAWQGAYTNLLGLIRAGHVIRDPITNTVAVAASDPHGRPLSETERSAADKAIRAVGKLADRPPEPSPEALAAASRTSDQQLKGLARLAGALGAVTGGAGADGSAASASSGLGARPPAWPESTAPKIIYASRTHSQLSQVVRELKKTGYTPRIAVYGGRETLCVHKSVSKMPPSAQNLACRDLTRKRGCVPKNNLDERVGRPGGFDMSALARAVAAIGGGGGAGAGGEESSGNAFFPTRGPAPVSSSAALLDIEELASAGRSAGVCSYYLCRDEEAQAGAELFFVPYSYLIDPAVRSQTFSPSFPWHNAILIFDEGHNVEDVAVEAAGWDLAPADLARAIAELDAAIQPFVVQRGTGELAWYAPPGLDASKVPLTLRLNEAVALKGGLLNLEAAIARVDVSEPVGPITPEKAAAGKVAGIAGAVMPGSYVRTLLEDTLRLTGGTADAQISLLDAAISFLAEKDELLGNVAALSTSATGPASRSPGLDHLRGVIERVFRRGGASGGMSDPRHYKVLFHKESSSGGGGGRAGGGGGGGGAGAALAALAGSKRPGGGGGGTTVSYWCLSPSVAFAGLRALGIRSFVLASGTLSPMASYAAELALPFPVRLENSHVIEATQVLVEVVRAGPDKTPLNSSFENRNTPAYKRALGATIADLLPSIPDGVLVFFPSYGQLESCLSFWQLDGGGALWSRIAAAKTPFTEPRGAAEFRAQIASYNAAVTSGRGAIFFAVCRGKISEGVDFADAFGRAVLVTGLPYPPHKDVKVALKRQYLNDNLAAATAAAGAGGAGSRPPPELLSGAVWYAQQAYRSVNQAVGRVIRHRRDYGAILLLDERFDREKGQLSAWLRPRVGVCGGAEEAKVKVARFFGAMRTREAREAAEGIGLGGGGRGGATAGPPRPVPAPSTATPAPRPRPAHAATVSVDSISPEMAARMFSAAARGGQPPSFVPQPQLGGAGSSSGAGAAGGAAPPPRPTGLLASLAARPPPSLTASEAAAAKAAVFEVKPSAATPAPSLWQGQAGQGRGGGQQQGGAAGAAPPSVFGFASATSGGAAASTSGGSSSTSSGPSFGLNAVAQGRRHPGGLLAPAPPPPPPRPPAPSAPAPAPAAAAPPAASSVAPATPAAPAAPPPPPPPADDKKAYLSALKAAVGDVTYTEFRSRLQGLTEAIRDAGSDIPFSLVHELLDWMAPAVLRGVKPAEAAAWAARTALLRGLAPFFKTSVRDRAADYIEGTITRAALAAAAPPASPSGLELDDEDLLLLAAELEDGAAAAAAAAAAVEPPIKRPKLN